MATPDPATPPPTTSPAASRFGLRGKLLLWVLPLVNVAFLGVWLISTTTARDGLVALSNANLGLGAQHLAGAMAQVLDDTYADAMTTARLDLPAQAIETGDSKNIVWYADEMVRTKGRYAAIVVANESGRIVAFNSVGADGSRLRVSLKGRSVAGSGWHEKALGSPKGVGTWTPVAAPEFLSGALAPGEKVLGVSFPVIDIMDGPIGTLSVFLSLDFLGKQLDGYFTMAEGMVDSAEGTVDSVAIVVDAANAAVILPSDLRNTREWTGATFPAPGGQSQWAGPSGQAYLSSDSVIGGRMGSQGFRLIAMKTVAALEAPVAQMGRRLLLAFGAAVALTTAVLVWLATRFVGPVRRLTEATAQVGRASELRAIDLATAGGGEIETLTRSFNQMIATIAAYEEGLSRMVDERTQELAAARLELQEILDNMRQAIFTIDRDGRLNRELSAYCRVIFGDRAVFGAGALELLQVTAERDPETYGRMHFWLANIVGSDQLQWTLTEGTGARELVYERLCDGVRERRFLELDYAPILKDGVVDRVMVIVKDVTDVRALEREVLQREDQNRKNLERIAEIAGMDPDLFMTFLEESSELLARCDDAVRALASALTNTAPVHELFRAMHTLKGNARIFKISTVQDAAHTVEEHLQRIRDGKDELSTESVEELEREVTHVRSLLDDIEKLGRRVLLGERALEIAGPLRAGTTRRGAPTLRVVEARILEVRKHYKDLSRLHGAAGDLPADIRKLHEELGEAVRSLTRVPLSDLFERCNKIVMDLSRELGKRVDDLGATGADIQVDTKLVDRMREVLLHALRNALDHGIEAPDARKANGKPERGTISVAARWQAGELVLEVADDGAGFHVGRIKQQALAKGLVTAEALDRMNEQEIIALAFMPGLSTAERITVVSGRGVGLDVIASTTKDLRGTVGVTSVAGKGTTLVLRIPADYYERL